MDFLPPSCYCDEEIHNILFIVDRMSASAIADPIYNNAWRHDGIPQVLSLTGEQTY